jgi:hypothetical protein
MQLWKEDEQKQSETNEDLKRINLRIMLKKRIKKRSL